MTTSTDTLIADPPASPATPVGRAAPRSRVAGSDRARRFWRGREQDPVWARPALLGLLLVTTVLYAYGLSANGWANSFYSAAVQAGSKSWEAFFFGSLDSSNAITVDKPPAALWVMALSVRAFGLSSLSILLPEVVMGVASIGVLYATVKRQFGAAAGLFAGLVLALTPVSVLMFRFNNPDAMLVLLMTIGAYATVRAVEKASPRWLVFVGVLIGLGFLTKMLQALLVVPAFALAYLLAAPTTLRRRIVHLLLAGLAMVLSAGWYIAVVELVPASLRPYIGGSQDNSMLNLTFGYNGFGRLTGNETGSVGGGGGGTGTGMWGATGLNRLFTADFGGQISWLVLSALVFLAVGLWLRGRLPRTDSQRAAYVVWGGWLVVTMLTFSLMAGIFHAYYTVALAPAIAALVGMGAAEAWQRRTSSVGRVTLAAATGAAALWSFVLLARTPDYFPWLRFAVVVVGLAAALMLLVVGRVHARAVPVIAAAAILSALAGPAAYSATTVASGYSGSLVTAGPAIAGAGFSGGRGGPGGQFPGAPGTTGTPGATGTARGGMGGLLDASTPSAAVVSALKAGSGSYTWVAAAIGAQNAAGYQLATGLPVMAIGGFNGTDSSPTPAQFQAYVQQGKIHYFAAGNGRGFGGQSSGSSSQISAWVAATYTQVSIGGSTFYDLTQPLSASTGSESSAAASV